MFLYLKNNRKKRGVKATKRYYLALSGMGRKKGSETGYLNPLSHMFMFFILNSGS